MQTHNDSDFLDRIAENSELSKLRAAVDEKQSDLEVAELIKKLTPKAEAMVADGKSVITSGADGEEPIKKYHKEGINVVRLPDDEDGVLRISIGGILDPRTDYVVYRGNPAKIKKLLYKALNAMKY